MAVLIVSLDGIASSQFSLQEPYSTSLIAGEISYYKMITGIRYFPLVELEI